MKKLFSFAIVFLCAVLMASSVSAATLPDAYSLYQKYAKKTQAMKSMEITVTSKTTATVGDYVTDLSKETAKLKMTSNNGKIEFEMKMTDSETKQTMTAYYRDNYFYVKMGNEKYKIKMSADDALSAQTNMDWRLTKEAFKNAKIEAVEGGYKITYKSDLKKVTDEKGKPVITSLIESLDLDSSVKVGYSELTNTITAKADGTPMGYSTSYSVKLDDGSDSVRIKSSSTSKIASFNSVKSISFPSDLSTYKEIR